jgi:hypothetical protein
MGYDFKVKYLGSDEDNRPLALGEYPVSDNPQSTKDELAEVLAFSPAYNSYLVVTRGSGGDPKQPGRRQLRGIPRKVDNPGMVAPLSTGTIVVINWELGFPYIDGVLNVNTVKGDVEGGVQEPMTIGSTGASLVTEDLSEDESQGYYRFPGTPMDVVGGDWVEVTPDGNYVGALRGNYNVMSAGKGHKAKFEQFGEKDLTRLTTGDYELLTDFGVLEMYNGEGRCGLSFKAAADQLTQSGGSEEQWTFVLDIGDVGDFFNMEVRNAAGQTQAKFHISPDGRVTIMGINGLDTINGGSAPQHEETAGPVIQRFLDKFTSIIEGAFHQEIRSTRRLEVSESESKVVGFNKSLSVNSNELTSIGGNRQETITGGPVLEASPLNVAVETQILNGSYHLEVGNPSLFASPAAQAGMTFALNNGEITMGQNPNPLAVPATKANVSLNTLLPNSVALGGTANPLSTNPALFHAVIFEVLAPILTAIATTFDAHVHSPPGTSPPVSVPMSTTVTPNIPNMMSIRVLIGA